MECIASTKQQERHRRKMALQLNVQRIRQGMRTAEQRRQNGSRRGGGGGCYATQRHSSPVESQSSTARPTTSACSSSSSDDSNGLVDIFNTARIESDLEESSDDENYEDDDADQDADHEGCDELIPTKRRTEHSAVCCICSDQEDREHDRLIRLRLLEAQTAILEDRMISQVIGSRTTMYYLYATMLLEFWNLERYVERTGQGAPGFVGRALRSMANARRRAQQMQREAQLKKKNKNNMQNSVDSTDKKKE